VAQDVRGQQVVAVLTERDERDAFEVDVRSQDLGDSLEDALQGPLAADGLPRAEYELRADGNFCLARRQRVWHCQQDIRSITFCC
jgi:hypothetical protein